MSGPNITTLSVGRLTVSGGSTTVIPLLPKFRYTPNVNNIGWLSGGDLGPTINAVNRASPMVEIDTTLDAAISLLGLGPKVLTGLDIFANTFTGGIRDSTGAKWAMAASAGGMACIDRLSWDGPDGIVVATIRIALYSSDGSDAPFTQAATSGATIPALSSAPIIHTGGPLAIAGVNSGNPFAGTSGWTINLGHRIVQEFSDGWLYPQTARSAGWDPSVAISHADVVNQMATLGDLGVNALSANKVSLWAHAFDANGVLLASGTCFQWNGRTELASGSYDALRQRPNADLVSLPLSTAGSSTYPISITTGTVP